MGPSAAVVRAFVLAVVLGAAFATPTTPAGPASAPKMPSAPPSAPAPQSAPAVPGSPVVLDEHTYEFFPIAESFYTPKASLSTAACMGIIGGIIGFLFLLFIVMVFVCNKGKQHHAPPIANDPHMAGHAPAFEPAPKVMVQQPLQPAVFLAPNATPYHSREPSENGDTHQAGLHHVQAQQALLASHSAQQAHLQAMAAAQASSGVGSSSHGSFYGAPPPPPAFPNSG